MISFLAGLFTFGLYGVLEALRRRVRCSECGAQRDPATLRDDGRCVGCHRRTGRP